MGTEARDDSICIGSTTRSGLIDVEVPTGPPASNSPVPSNAEKTLAEEIAEAVEAAVTSTDSETSPRVDVHLDGPFYRRVPPVCPECGHGLELEMARFTTPRRVSAPVTCPECGLSGRGRFELVDVEATRAKSDSPASAVKAGDLTPEVASY